MLTASMRLSNRLATIAKVSAKAYAHAVHLILPQGALPADNFFDLLPGETREIQIVSTEPIDAAAIGVTCVNS